MSILKRTIVVAGVVLLLVSPNLKQSVNQWEKRVNIVYPDKLAHGLPTVCTGITKYATTQSIIIGDYWSDLKCDEIEELVLSKSQIKIASCIKRPITQFTYDALGLMGHNVGAGAVCASRALGLINAGRTAEGCMAISQAPDGSPVWSFVTDRNGNPVFVQGLYNRRKAETKMCLQGLT